MTPYGDIDQGHSFSGNDLLPDCSVAFTWEQFTTSVQATTLYNEFENYAFDITVTSPRGQWVQLATTTTTIQYNPKYAHGFFLVLVAVCKRCILPISLGINSMAREIIALVSVKQPWWMWRIKSPKQKLQEPWISAENVNKEKYVIKNPFSVYVYVYE